MPRDFSSRLVAAGIAAAMMSATEPAQNPMKGLEAVRCLTARDFLFHGPGHHPGSGDGFGYRHAFAHGARGLVGDTLLDHDCAGAGLLFGDAFHARHLALNLLLDRLAHGHLAGLRPIFAHPFHARHGNFFPDLARHPDLDGLRRRGTAGIGARVAAVAATAQLVEAIQQPMAAARNFPAFIVAPVNTFPDRARNRLASNDFFHDRAFFFYGDALANRARFGAGLGNLFVHRAGIRPGFRNALTPVGGVRFLMAFHLVGSSRTRILFGHPFNATNFAGATGRRATIAGSGGNCRRGREDACQQNHADTLPDHSLLLD